MSTTKPITKDVPGHIDVLDDGTQVELYEGAFDYVAAHPELIEE